MRSVAIRQFHIPAGERRSAWRRCARFTCGLLLALSWTVAAHGAPFEINSASIVPAKGVYLLDAQLRFTLPNGARQAIRDGVPLTVTLEMDLEHARHWWFDESIAKLEQRYEIVYHALSDYYLLRNLNSGEQTVHTTLDAALAALCAVHDLPVLDQSLLDPRLDYQIRVRASLDVRTLPDTLRMVLFWTDDWRQHSDWYIWPLNP